MPMPQTSKTQKPPATQSALANATRQPAMSASAADAARGKRTAPPKQPQKALTQVQTGPCQELTAAVQYTASRHFVQHRGYGSTEAPKATTTATSPPFTWPCIAGAHRKLEQAPDGVKPTA